MNAWHPFELYLKVTNGHIQFKVQIIRGHNPCSNWCVCFFCNFNRYNVDGHELLCKLLFQTQTVVCRLSSTTLISKTSCHLNLNFLAESIFVMNWSSIGQNFWWKAPISSLFNSTGIVIVVLQYISFRQIHSLKLKLIENFIFCSFFFLDISGAIHVPLSKLMCKLLFQIQPVFC